jgi:uncharacterized protein YutE (UPF0331/DUF86 family)
MMVNKRGILDHLREFDDALSDLDRYKREMISLERFSADRDKQHMVLHAMLVAIQSSIDIANHIIAENRLKRPDSYKEAFEILKDKGFMSSQLSETLSGLAGFRNVLVHIYWKVDLRSVYNILQEDLWALRDFEKIVKEITYKEP